MHLNYYTLKRLSKQLAALLSEAQLIAAFSQEKEELILGFSLKDHSDFFIRATLQSDFTALSFPKDFARSRKNNVDLFPSIINQRVTSVHQYENERAFHIGFQNKSKLIFKLHGNRSNIILCKEGQENQLFKKKLIKDDLLIPKELERPIERSLDQYLANPNYSAFYPTFGKLIKQHLLELNFEALKPTDQWALLQQIENQLESNSFYLIEVNNTPALSLIKFKDGLELFDSPIDALNQFYHSYHRDFLFEREKNKAISVISKRINQARAYIQKTEHELHLLEKAIPPNHLADIIMANLHAITKGSKSAILFNFYTNEEVEIKLNKDLAPQKNAENYYRKSKNRTIEINKLTENLLNKEEQIIALELLSEELGQADSIKPLRQILKSSPFFADKEKTEVILPYKLFTHQGYQIWVGKNAKANDELTLKYAFKEDLWLHAKDVPGSHVLIKHQSGKNTPVNVIERAAAYAAYYSKRKTDTLVPVIYTPVKYVRKKKGAAAGQVFVSQEKVLMTPALGPQD
jgi:predicted ribosome quality control (RQC) complex YloA/Tae2 family protein